MTFKFELKLNWKFGDPEFPEAIQIQNELFKKKKKIGSKMELIFSLLKNIKYFLFDFHPYLYYRLWPSPLSHNSYHAKFLKSNHAWTDCAQLHHIN